jgi:hypothetical protein
MVLAAKALGFDDETIDKKKKTDVAAMHYAAGWPRR